MNRGSSDELRWQGEEMMWWLVWIVTLTELRDFYENSWVDIFFEGAPREKSGVWANELNRLTLNMGSTNPQA